MGHKSLHNWYSQCTATVWSDETRRQQWVSNAADVVLEDLADVETEIHFFTFAFRSLFVIYPRRFVALRLHWIWFCLLHNVVVFRPRCVCVVCGVVWKGWCGDKKRICVNWKVLWQTFYWAIRRPRTENRYFGTCANSVDCFFVHTRRRQKRCANNNNSLCVMSSSLSTECVDVTTNARDGKLTDSLWLSRW